MTSCMIFDVAMVDSLSHVLLMWVVVVLVLKLMRNARRRLRPRLSMQVRSIYTPQSNKKKVLEIFVRCRPSCQHPRWKCFGNRLQCYWWGICIIIAPLAGPLPLTCDRHCIHLIVFFSYVPLFDPSRTSNHASSTPKA
jgi:hypothetical protein